MIAPVSFGSVAASSNTSFADKIRQPQTYVVKEEQPNAASPINGSKEKGKAGKVVGGLAVTAAIVATALGVLSKKGGFATLLTKFKDNAVLQKILPKLDTAGNVIAEKAAWAKNKVVDLVSKLPEALGKLKDKAPETGV